MDNHTSINFWSKGLGYGVLIWIIMYLIVVFFSYYGGYLSSWIGLLVAVIGGLISYLFALAAMPGNASSAIMYGIIWVVVGLILDGLITRMYIPEIYSYWAYWLEYLIILLAPLLAVKKFAPTTTPNV